MTKIIFQQPVNMPPWAKRHKHKIRYPRVRPTYEKALYILEVAAQKLGIDEMIITTNHQLSFNGSVGHNNQGPAVAVYFFYKNEKFVIAQDIFFTTKENLYAIAKTIKAYAVIKEQQCKAVNYTSFEEDPDDDELIFLNSNIRY